MCVCSVLNWSPVWAVSGCVQGPPDASGYEMDGYYVMLLVAHIALNLSSCLVALMAKVNASPKKKVQAKMNTSGTLMAPPADPSVNAPRKFSGFTGKAQIMTTHARKTIGHVTNWSSSMKQSASRNKCILDTEIPGKRPENLNRNSV